MSQNQVFNNTTYQIPVTGDVRWGPSLTRYLAALGTYAISPAGGTYTLTADLNLGASFGLLTAYYKSAASNIAASGLLRLAHTDMVSWRNNANSGDLALSVNSSDELLFNGSVLNQLAIPVTVANGGTGVSSLTAYGLVYGGTTSTGPVQSLATGSATQVLTSQGPGQPPVWSAAGAGTVSAGTQYQLAYYATSTNAVSGLTLLTASCALASDSNGLPVASSTTATELGYVHGVTSALQTQIDAKLPKSGGTMSGDIAMGSHHIDGATYFSGSSSLSTGNSFPASGIGVGIGYASGSSKGFIQAYDIGENAYKALELDTTALTITNGSGTTFLTAQSSGVSFLGTNTNDSAAAGNVGEFVRSYVSAVTFPTHDTWGDLTSISLTAGDWDISAVLAVHSTGAVSYGGALLSVTTTSGNSQTGAVYGDNYIQSLPGNLTTDVSLSIPSYRVSISSTTTFYLKSFIYTNTTNITGYGRVSARRAR